MSQLPLYYNGVDPNLDWIEIYNNHITLDFQNKKIGFFHTKKESFYKVRQVFITNTWVLGSSDPFLPGFALNVNMAKAKLPPIKKLSDEIYLCPIQYLQPIIAHCKTKSKSHSQVETMSLREAYASKNTPRQKTVKTPCQTKK